MQKSEKRSLWHELGGNEEVGWFGGNSHEQDDVGMSKGCEHLDLIVGFVEQVLSDVGVKDFF
jgi:hypothetical protein